MKIGIVSEYYYPTLGGIQEHVYHFANQAKRLGHQPVIITSCIKDLPAKVDRCQTVPVERIGWGVPFFQNGGVARVSLDPLLKRKLLALFERYQFDVIHVHAPISPNLSLLALSQASTWTFGTLHTHFSPNLLLRLFQRPLQRLLNRMNGIISVSQTATRSMERLFRIKVRVIPNGVDTNFFHPEVEPLAEYADGKFNLLMVSRMEPRSNLDLMIKAFSLAYRKRNDLRLIVVGDGPLRQYYQSLVPPDCKQGVVFTGFLNGLRRRVFASAQVLCAPIQIASFGIVLLEGMAAGLPIIASDIDGFRDIMSHEQEGIFVDPTNSLRFAQTILSLSQDRERAAVYGYRGRQTALGYSWDKVTDRVMAYYRECGVAA